LAKSLPTPLHGTNVPIIPASLTPVECAAIVAIIAGAYLPLPLSTAPAASAPATAICNPCLCDDGASTKLPTLALLYPVLLPRIHMLLLSHICTELLLGRLEPAKVPTVRNDSQGPRLYGVVWNFSHVKWATFCIPQLHPHPSLHRANGRQDKLQGPSWSAPCPSPVWVLDLEWIYLGRSAADSPVLGTSSTLAWPRTGSHIGARNQSIVPNRQLTNWRKVEANGPRLIVYQSAD
jgi:hypothetical protein